VGFEVLTPVVMKISAICDVMWHSPLKVNWLNGVTDQKMVLFKLQIENGIQWFLMLKVLPLNIKSRELRWNLKDMHTCVAVKCIQGLTLCDFNISCHTLMKWLHSGSQVSLKAVYFETVNYILRFNLCL
jgi:hypothetical protein